MNDKKADVKRKEPLKLKTLPNNYVMANAVVIKGTSTKYGANYVLMNDTQILWLNEGTTAFNQMAEIYDKVKDSVVNVEFEQKQSANNRVYVVIKRIAFVRHREKAKTQVELQGFA